MRSINKHNVTQTALCSDILTNLLGRGSKPFWSMLSTIWSFTVRWDQGSGKAKHLVISFLLIKAIVMFIWHINFRDFFFFFRLFVAFVQMWLHSFHSAYFDTSMRLTDGRKRPKHSAVRRKNWQILTVRLKKSKPLKKVLVTAIQKYYPLAVKWPNNFKR